MNKLICIVYSKEYMNIENTCYLKQILSENIKII